MTDVVDFGSVSYARSCACSCGCFALVDSVHMDAVRCRACREDPDQGLHSNPHAIDMSCGTATEEEP